MLSARKNPREKPATPNPAYRPYGRPFTNVFRSSCLQQKTADTRPFRPIYSDILRGNSPVSRQYGEQATSRIIAHQVLSLYHIFRQKSSVKCIARVCKTEKYPSLPAICLCILTFPVCAAVSGTSLGSGESRMHAVAVFPIAHPPHMTMGKPLPHRFPQTWISPKNKRFPLAYRMWMWYYIKVV